MTSLSEIKALRDTARSRGRGVTLFYNEQGVMDQVYIQHLGLRDPLGAAEILRAINSSGTI